VLVHAEDLLHHEHDGERSALRGLGPVGGNGAVGGRDLHLAGLEALRVGGDRRLRRHRLRRKRKPGRERRHHRLAPRGLELRKQALHVRGEVGGVRVAGLCHGEAPLLAGVISQNGADGAGIKRAPRWSVLAGTGLARRAGLFPGLAGRLRLLLEPDEAAVLMRRLRCASSRARLSRMASWLGWLGSSWVRNGSDLGDFMPVLRGRETLWDNVPHYREKFPIRSPGDG
jgi:hypothetical protein